MDVGMKPQEPQCLALFFWERCFSGVRFFLVACLFHHINKQTKQTKKTGYKGGLENILAQFL